MHLLRNGGREIQLSLHGNRRRYVEIRAAGEAEDFSEPVSTEDDDSRITSEIRMNLLGRYAGFYNFHYQKGVNRFRIYPDA